MSNCCCQREICTYDPDTGCGSRRMFGDGWGRRGGTRRCKNPTDCSWPDCECDDAVTLAVVGSTREPL